jgi:competence protein ComEA
MTSRSQTRTAAGTGTGMGMSPGSGTGPVADTAAGAAAGRHRYRHRLHVPRAHPHTHLHRRRTASADALRRRADLLFPGRQAEARDPVAVGGGRDPAAEPGGGRAEPGGGRRQRIASALRDRLPVWVQTRCGVERRGVLALTVVLAAVSLFAAQHFWTGRTETVRAPEAVRAVRPAGEEAREAEPGDGSVDSAGADGPGGTTAPGRPTGPGPVGGSAGGEIVVDVSGKVRRPGIHRLPAGSRVADALRAAGGVRPGTDTDGLNRARFLVDGEQVLVGGPGPGAGAGAGGAMGGSAVTGAAGVAGAASGAVPGAPVVLSTATLEQLDTLPGVGPVLAQHIIDYRTRNGGFRSVDELREVNGIGDRRFADLRDLVRP